MKIIIGSDHAAVGLKAEIVKYLCKDNEIVDVGVKVGAPSSDYPDIADLVCAQVKLQSEAIGILICGTGIGMSIAANRRQGIRCALCGDVFSAKMARQHNNANILALGERVVGIGLAIEIVDAFLKNNFSNEPRHIRRIDKLDNK